MGFGRDRTGSAEYLEPTLRLISVFNAEQNPLTVLHVDGDGHCLV
jgi:hypothetical protein